MGSVGNDVSNVFKALPSAQMAGTAGQIFGKAGDALGLGAGPNISGYSPSSTEDEFTRALMARYNGTAGPSAAELQMQQGLGQANQNALAVAASQRGINPALAAKMATDEQSRNTQQALQGSGILRAQESNAAGGNLASLLSSQRQSASAANQLQASVNQANGNRLLSAVGMGVQGAAMMAGGGEVGDYHGSLLNFGGDQKSPVSFLKKKKASGGSSDIGGGGDDVTMIAGGPMDAGSMQAGTMVAAHGGKVPALLSPGEKYLSPHEADAVASGDRAPLKKKDIPGKAKVRGDSLENDTVSRKLEPGGVVVPRTENESDDKAAEFVAQLKGKKEGRPKSYGDVLSKHRALESRVKELEAKLKAKK